MVQMFVCPSPIFDHLFYLCHAKSMFRRGGFTVGHLETSATLAAGTTAATAPRGARGDPVPDSDGSVAR